jgi:hypothetical protein
MKPSKISEEQEWQLFELLEGNLSEAEAANLHQQMQSDGELKAHFNALAQTYLQPTFTPFPDASSLKKKGSSRTVLFYISFSAAAALAILWIFRPTVSTHIQTPINIATHSDNPFTDKTTPGTPESEPRTQDHDHREINKGRAILSQLSKPTQTGKFGSNKSEDLNETGVHPLILATEPVRKVKNINDSSFQRSTEVFASQNNANASNKPLTSETIQTAIAQRTPKTKRELLKSFYQDARRMVENGHLPHVNVKTVNRDQDWMPEFQVGLTLENNVILTSFNPE